MSPILTEMVFIEDARDARKACECRQDYNVLIGPRKPIEVVGLKSHTRAIGQCELLPYRVTKEGEDAAD